MLSGTAQSSLDEEVIQRCCTLCAETASRLIETLHENLNTLYRSSGWHSVYCKFLCFHFLRLQYLDSFIASQSLDI